LAGGMPLLALLAFIGGVSAAAGMVIVEAGALSTMVSNDLVMPVLLRVWPRHIAGARDMGQNVLRIRRAGIVLLLGLGLIYLRIVGEGSALVSMGLVSFAAMAQLAPSIVVGLYWRGASRTGAIVGILAGFAVWSWTLFLPALARSGLLTDEFVH